MTPRPHADLVAHLVRTTPLNEGEADRVLAEVLDWFGEPVPAPVTRPVVAAAVTAEVTWEGEAEGLPCR